MPTGKAGAEVAALMAELRSLGGFRADRSIRQASIRQT
jgi:hypothetical protein